MIFKKSNFNKMKLEKQTQLEKLFPEEINALKQNKCPFCKKEINVEKEFRDSLSKKEFNISGLCQTCQDKTFGV